MVDFHASLTPVMVQRLVELVAYDRGLSFDQARILLAMRWEEYAVSAKEKGLSTWRMWDEMGMMALRSSDSREEA